MDPKFAAFDGGIPENYDHGLGPYLFDDFGRELAGLVAASEPKRVLELACGTGIVSRHLRDALPPDAELVATDLNAPMLEIAQAKFAADERVRFEPANAMELA